MGLTQLLGKLFGNKSTRDMQDIKPWVEKVKAAYPEIQKLDNDSFRAKTKELQQFIKDSAKDKQSKKEKISLTILTS